MIGALKIALYAEGAGETVRSPGHGFAPGDILPLEALGAGHLLIRSILSRDLPFDSAAIQFVRPLRLRARDARGSDLLDARAVGQLLNWPRATKAPGASILLVDTDGKSDRLGTVRSFIDDPTPLAWAGAASPEFEAWLLADHVAAQDALQLKFEMGTAPDDLSPGEAKAFLATQVAIARASRELPAERLRRAISERLDIDRAAARSKSFSRFRSELVEFIRRVLA